MADSGDLPISGGGALQNWTLNPYLALGLQCNPFVAEDEPGVPEPLWLDRGWSDAPPKQAARLVQVLGVKGAGKTSHLSHWQAQTRGPYCYYPPGWGRLKMPQVAAIAYWDEADRIPLPYLLSALTWARLTRATIVAGTHRDLGAIARGLNLAVQTIHLQPFDGETLSVWANRRIAAVRLPSQNSTLTLTPERAEKIAAIAQGSWRDAADALHIWAAATAAETCKKLGE
ncbi:MAG: hypothetical protein AAFW84_28270 [Cyanobacteria bacterium J06635_15]